MRRSQGIWRMDENSTLSYLIWIIINEPKRKVYLSQNVQLYFFQSQHLLDAVQILKIYESEKWCSFPSSLNSKSQKWYEMFEEINDGFTSSYNNFIAAEFNFIKSRWGCFKNLSHCSMLNARCISCNSVRRVHCLYCIH